MTPQKFDIYQVVTDKIIAQLEAGVDGAWQMPWHTAASLDMPRNIQGRPYRGANTLLLWIRAATSGYQTPVWGTYKAWSEAGAQVRKGEQGTMVVFWKPYVAEPGKRRTPEENNGKTDDGRRLVLRYYIVFNAAQVDGYTPPEIPEVEKLDENDRVLVAENFFKATGSRVVHGGARAFYAPSRDEIHLPNYCDFKDAISYYATSAHEHVHWTGHESRLDRKLLTSRFGDQAYAFEELVAEFGAAFLCANLGLSNEPRKDHARYLASWLQVLKDDKKALFTAVSKAQAAVDFLCQEEVDEPEEANGK